MVWHHQWTWICKYWPRKPQEEIWIWIFFSNMMGAILHTATNCTWCIFSENCKSNQIKELNCADSQWAKRFKIRATWNRWISFEMTIKLYPSSKWRKAGMPKWYIIQFIVLLHCMCIVHSTLFYCFTIEENFDTFWAKWNKAYWRTIREILAYCQSLILNLVILPTEFLGHTLHGNDMTYFYQTSLINTWC